MAEGHGITDKTRLRSLLLHSAGPAVQGLYEDLVDPAANPPDNDDDYACALRKLEAHFKATPQPVFERHVFHQMSLGPGESVSSFVVRLCHQARLCHCSFGDSADDLIEIMLSLVFRMLI